MRPANERQRYIVMLSLIGWMPTQNDSCMWYDIEAKHRSEFALTKHTSYLRGELRGVYCEHWGQNWPRYYGVALDDGEYNYRKTSNISRTIAGNNIVDHSDVVGVSPVGAAPTTSSFST